ncbi:unnamed protein product [Sphenostylis stenocarpa]|uniref:Uncharacterized protein n=1 Tax=Sphenostylis stenocarpa TaxID=92480 RepID=A0AA86W4L9_9FABA|nr:unnamed protein product [Sphenostylis stenocarpa]
MGCLQILKETGAVGLTGKAKRLMGGSKEIEFIILLIPNLAPKSNSRLDNWKNGRNGGGEHGVSLEPTRIGARKRVALILQRRIKTGVKFNVIAE